MKTIAYPHFQILSTPFCSFCSIISLLESVIMPHLMCLLNNIIDLNLIGLDTLVDKDLVVCFMQQSIKFTEALRWITWFFLVLRCDVIPTETNRLRHTYKYILTAPVICTHQIIILHWMNSIIIQRFTLLMSKMSLLFKNYSFFQN